MMLQTHLVDELVQQSAFIRRQAKIIDVKPYGVFVEIRSGLFISPDLGKTQKGSLLSSCCNGLV